MTVNISRQLAASGGDLASEPRLGQVYFIAHVACCSLVRLGVVWSGLVRLASYAVVGGGGAPLGTSVSAKREGSPTDELPNYLLSQSYCTLLLCVVCLADGNVGRFARTCFPQQRQIWGGGWDVEQSSSLKELKK